MKKLITLLIPLLLLSACSNTYEFHFRRTVIIDTPDGEARASIVSKIVFEHSDSWYMTPEVRGFSSGISQGEATVVDLGDGRYLFVLLGKESAQLREANRAVYDAAVKGDGNWIPRWMKALGQQRSPRPVPPEFYPLLVTFDDINDPASVKRVDPGDLAATFGPGFALRSVTLEITDEPVTVGGVEAVLGWFYDVTFLTPPSERPRYVKDLTPEQRVSLNDFIDWKTQYNRRKGD